MSKFKEVIKQRAVALSYDEEKNRAPIIVASGTGYMAEKMIEIANENKVPVYEDNSLATVLTQLELGSEIPEELYRAVVDIYAYFLGFANREHRQKVQEQIGKQEEKEAVQVEIPEK